MDAIAVKIVDILNQPIDNPTSENLAAWLLAGLPDKEENLTPDQQKDWERMRQFNIYAESCWLSLSGGDDPIKEWKKGSKLERLLYDLIWGLVYELQALLNLLRHTYTDISEVLRFIYFHPGYESSFELFMAIVSEDQNQHFQQQLQPYSRFSLGDAAKNHDLLRQSPKSLKPLEIKRLKRLVKSQTVNSLKMIALTVCQVKATQDPLINNLLKTYQDKITFNSDVRRRACAAADKGKLPGIYSYEVRQGIEYRIKRGGGTS